MGDFVTKYSDAIYHPRNKFTFNFRNSLTSSVGRLVPFFLREVNPGDSLQIPLNAVCKVISSFIKNVVDELFLDTYFFYVPSRILYDDFEHIFSQPDPASWEDDETATAPVTDQGCTVTVKSVADYLGLPVGDVPEGLNILPFRAFAKIYNDWFRDENVIDPMLIQSGVFNNAVELIDSDPWSAQHYTGMCPNIAKMHDYFTSALPNTQKGAPVSVPLVNSDFLPLTAGSTMSNLGSGMRVGMTSAVGSGIYNIVAQAPSSGSTSLNVAVGSSGQSLQGSDSYVNATNLGISADEFESLTVNDLRLLFATQSMLEQLGTFGSRYNEYIRAFFGVDSQDARLQMSEYIGGKRIPLQISAIAQTTQAETDSVTNSLGSMAGTMIANGTAYAQKFCPEYGYIIGVCAIRQMHRYQQGIHPLWMRSTTYDFYNPKLAHIGWQPIYGTELYADSANELKKDIFGYKPAWEEFRTGYSMVAGDMRSGSNNSLDVYHFADDYANMPTLSQGFIEEIPDYVDRTLAVPSTSIDQFAIDFYSKITLVGRYPLTSVPKLVG